MTDVDKRPAASTESNSGADRTSNAHGPKTEGITTVDWAVGDIRKHVRVARQEADRVLTDESAPAPDDSTAPYPHTRCDFGSKIEGDPDASPGDDDGPGRCIVRRQGGPSDDTRDDRKARFRGVPRDGGTRESGQKWVTYLCVRDRCPRVRRSRTRRRLDRNELRAAAVGSPRIAVRNALDTVSFSRRRLASRPRVFAAAHRTR
jgi:hypothetical protein